MQTDNTNTTKEEVKPTGGKWTYQILRWGADAPCSGFSILSDKKQIAGFNATNSSSIIETDTYKRFPDLAEIHFTAAEAEANAAHIVKCVNAHDELVSIAKTVKAWFGNEANYPEGTSGYRLAQDAKTLLSNLK